MSVITRSAAANRAYGRAVSRNSTYDIVSRLVRPEVSSLRVFGGVELVPVHTRHKHLVHCYGEGFPAITEGACGPCPKGRALRRHLAGGMSSIHACRLIEGAVSFRTQVLRRERRGLPNGGSTHLYTRGRCH